MPTHVFDLPTRKISRLAAPSAASAAFSDLGTDTLHLVDGVQIKPTGGGSTSLGLWRGRRYLLNSFPGFAWGRVNADFSAGVVLRLYAGGALFYTTPTITSRVPFRLPAGRHKSWEIEVESSDRVTSVVVASSIEELR